MNPLHINDEDYAELTAAKNIGALSLAADILTYHLMVKHKKQVVLNDRPNTIVASSLQHIVPSKNNPTGNPALMNEYGDTIAETTSVGFSDGKIKLVIQEVVPEDHTEAITNLARTLVSVEIAKSKISPPDNSNKALEYLNIITNGLAVYTDETINEIKHPDELV